MAFDGKTTLLKDKNIPKVLQIIHRYRGLFYRLVPLALLLFIFISIFTVSILQSSSSQQQQQQQPSACFKVERTKFNFEDVKCFQFAHSNKSEITFLLDVMDAKIKPRQDSIFFIESSCSKDGLINLTPRQLCSIESAAVSNPNRDVFVLFVSPVGRAAHPNMESKLVSVLLSYPNIFLRNLNLPKYVNNTPVEDWFYSGALFDSIYLEVHTSDFLRLLSVYKWGGTYFDLDFVVLKNLDKLEPNFFGTELEEGRTGNSVINFNRNGIGHDIASLTLQHFTWRYNATSWDNGGPLMLRRIAEQSCQTKNHLEFTRENCVGFEVYPYWYFYPVHGITEADRIYDDKYLEWTLNKTKNAFGIHTWNMKTRSLKITYNEPNSAYSYWVKNFCPKMYEITKHDIFGKY